MLTFWPAASGCGWPKNTNSRVTHKFALWGIFFFFCRFRVACRRTKGTVKLSLPRNPPQSEISRKTSRKWRCAGKLTRDQYFQTTLDRKPLWLNAFKKYKLTINEFCRNPLFVHYDNVTSYKWVGRVLSFHKEYNMRCVSLKSFFPLRHTRDPFHTLLTVDALIFANETLLHKHNLNP